MKTRVIALVLAVCMMLGLCAFASAAGDVHVHSTNGAGEHNCFAPSFIYEDLGGGYFRITCINCRWSTVIH